MIISFEERKQKYVEYINEDYRPKRIRCWESYQPTYITTKEFCEDSPQFPPGTEETVIKFNLERALDQSALFFIFLLGTSFYYYIKNPAEAPKMLFFIMIYILIMIPYFLHQKKHDVQIRMDKNGIWLDSTQKWINWNQFVASFIRIEEDDDGKDYFLVIHYYDSFHDRFFQTNIALQHFDIPAKKIIAEMEYRKRIAAEF